MATAEVNTYQLDLLALLAHRIPGVPMQAEWAAMQVEPGLYSPRLDAAVGPFAIAERLIDAYAALCVQHRPLLEALFAVHRDNLIANRVFPDQFSFNHVISRNRNSRCFLAIEIENQVSQKHLIGGAINAAALGRVGLAIAWNDRNLRRFIRMRSYLLFLSDVGKNSFDPSNLLIMTAGQLKAVLQQDTR